MSDEPHNKFDWRSIGVTAAIIFLQGAVQYGILTSKIDDLERRMERVEQKLDEKFLTRDEYEKRNQDLERRVEENRESIQHLDMDDRKRHP